MVDRDINMNDVINVPAPTYVSERLIARCRAEIETAIKRNIRALILPFLGRRYGLAELGEGFQWGAPIHLGKGSRIGRYVYVGKDFVSQGPVSVGDLTMISAECKIVGEDHLYDVVGTPTRLAFSDARQTTVFGADVWIGRRVTIREGVMIGDGAIVGSGAQVTKNIEPYTIVAGVPAKPVKVRFEGEMLARHIEMLFSSVLASEQKL